jgi:eukaryotic-like serine/threonine-protein kinase
MTLIGAYQIEKILGEGATSTVFLAHHIQTKQRVALKSIKSLDKNFLRGLRHEIQALSRLHHPNIVRIFEEGLHLGSPFYAMEILEGCTLERWMSVHLNSDDLNSKTEIDSLVTTRRVQIPQAATYQEPAKTTDTKRYLPPGATQKIYDLGRALCEPLHYLHCKGLVHLDLKPANIFIEAAQRPVLVDFGMVSRFSNETGREQLQMSTFGGTPYYMSPEQIAHEDCDARSDLYSLGCILYHMLVGHPPFMGSVVEVLLAHQSQTPIPPSTLVEGIPEALDELILRMLIKQPQQRVGYAETVASSLEALGAASPTREGLKDTYLYRTALVGRERPFTQLTDGLQKAQQNKGQLWLLGGECGAGKTRLALELAKYAQRQHLEVLSGEGQELSPAPFKALKQPFDTLIDYCAAKGANETQRIIGRYLWAFAGLIPAFSRLSTSQDKPNLTFETSEQIYQALSTIFGRFATVKPILLIIDDLQWADELLLGWLSWVAATPPKSAVMIVGLYRTEEMTPTLRALLSQEQVRQLSLGALAPLSIQKIAEETLSTTPPKEFSDFLQKNSEGNPLFIREYLRAAVEDKHLQRDSDGRWYLAAPLTLFGVAKQIPGALQSLLLRRIRLLEADEFIVAMTAAIFEEELDLSLLRRLIPLEESRLQEALQGLQQKEILRGAPLQTWRFTHEKLRELCYQEQEPSARKEAHQSLAKLLEVSHSEAAMASIASHWEKAESATKACEWYLRAARFSARRFALQEATRLYRAFLRLEASPSAESITAHNELGDMLQLQGKSNEAIQEFTLAAQLSATLQDTAQAAESQRQLGCIHRKIGKLHEARQFLEEALHLSREAKAIQVEGATLNNLANVAYERAEFDAAAALFHEALRLHQSTSSKREEGLVLANLAMLFVQRGNYKEAKELTLKALTIAQTLGNRRSEGIIYNNLAEIFVLSGLRKEATEAHHNSLSIAQEVGNKRSEGVVLNNLSAVLYDEGELDSAHQYCLDAIQIHQEVGNKRSLAISIRRLALISLWLPAELALIDSYCAQAESIFTALSSKSELAKLYCLQGHLRLCRNQSAEDLLLLVKKSSAEDLKNQALTQMQRDLNNAQQDFLQGVALLNGYRAEDIPAPILHWFQSRRPR